MFGRATITLRISPHFSYVSDGNCSIVELKGMTWFVVGSESALRLGSEWKWDWRWFNTYSWRTVTEARSDISAWREFKMLFVLFWLKLHKLRQKDQHFNGSVMPHSHLFKSWGLLTHKIGKLHWEISLHTIVLFILLLNFLEKKEEVSLLPSVMWEMSTSQISMMVVLARSWSYDKTDEARLLVEHSNMLSLGWNVITWAAPSWWHVNLGTTYLNVPLATVIICILHAAVL